MIIKLDTLLETSSWSPANLATSIEDDTLNEIGGNTICPCPRAHVMTCQWAKVLTWSWPYELSARNHPLLTPHPNFCAKSLRNFITYQDVQATYDVDKDFQNIFPKWDHWKICTPNQFDGGKHGSLPSPNKINPFIISKFDVWWQKSCFDFNAINRV